jgi:thiosulfate/3-mercaptopyruvate sulfurtransferase
MRGSSTIRLLFGFMLVLPGSPSASAAIGHSQEDVPALRQELLVSADWLSAHLQEPNLVVLCIAQDAHFYERGHIPGARLVRLTDITEERDGVPHGLPSVEKLQAVFSSAGVNDDSKIILYGERLGLLAARAFFTLDYLGRADHSALLDGGLETWKREGRALSIEIPAVSKGNFTSQPRREILIDLEGMRSLSRAAAGNNASGAVVLDARPPEEFSGLRFSQDVPRAGHIPGAACLYWMELLESRENPVLKPLAELRRIYSAAGARRSTRVVTYCRTGMQSSMDFFVARYLGYSAGMYAASFFEWGRTDAPVQLDK